jgi:hypothetical protein
MSFKTISTNQFMMCLAELFSAHKPVNEISSSFRHRYVFHTQELHSGAVHSVALHRQLRTDGPRFNTLQLKLHLFDLLWICCTKSCTANPQQFHNKSTASPKIIETVQFEHMETFKSRLKSHSLQLNTVKSVARVTDSYMRFDATTKWDASQTA